VVYGANSCYTSPRSFTNGTACNNDVFGDPVSGVHKYCYTNGSSSSGWAYQIFHLGDFNGEKYESNQTITDLSSIGKNDWAESIKINSGYEIIACSDANFSGSCGRVTGPAQFSDINALAQGLRDGLSSIKVCAGSCPQPPSANFDAWPQSGVAPLTVAMHIVSTANITSCSWNYGDGQTGTSCDSSHNHVYNNAGSYSVSLWVSGPGGSHQQLRTDYITVSPQDTTPPSVSWIAPVGDEQVYDVYNQSIQLEVNANDNVGISYVSYYRWDYVTLNYIEIGTVYNPPYRLNFDTSVLLPEWNYITANAYDAANNSSSKYIWLNHIQTPTLTVNKTGTGSGTVTSNPAGINCGSDCSEPYTYNTVVTLTASPTSPSTFGGWSGGGCSGTGTCTITMSSVQSVTATFNSPPDLVPYPRTGHQDPVIISPVSGTSTNDTLYIGQPAYIDWGFKNTGGSDVNTNYYVDLYIDDQRLIHYPFTSLGAGGLGGFDDWAETWNTSGWHTVKLVVDPENTVSENNENNNIWTGQFYWALPVPAMPSNLAVSGATAHSLTLTWQDNSNNESGFKIYRWGWDGTQNSFLYLATVGANVTTYTQTSLLCGSDFNYYEVSAFNSYGESAHTGWEQGTTAACPLAPNDDFDSPTIISQLPYTHTLETTGATKASDDPDLTQCNRLAGMASVWYRYTPSVAGGLRLDTIGSDYDTMLAVWSGLRGSLTPIGCNDDIGLVNDEWDPDSKLTIRVNPGVTYYIEISQFNGSSASAASIMDIVPRTLPRPGTGIPSGAPPKLDAGIGASATSLKPTLDVSAQAGGTLNFHVSVTYPIFLPLVIQ
jgi:PKD repeat protein